MDILTDYCSYHISEDESQTNLMITDAQSSLMIADAEMIIYTDGASEDCRL